MVKSGVWGNIDANNTNPFGQNPPGVPDEWYRYAADWGYPVGTHIGVDIGVEKGTPIYAAADGVVIQEGEDLQSFRPNPVWIETPDDPATPDDETEHHIYGHLWSDVVSPGQVIKKGQLIGYSGEQTVRGTWTPDGSGPHLHFERRDISEGRALDPMPLLSGEFSPVSGGGVTRIDPAKINARIEKSERANGSTSKLHGMGEKIVAWGNQYGVNPAVVVAISQRECQLGAATNDILPPVNNFGGHTCGAVGVTLSNGCMQGADRQWNTYPTPEAGMEAMFQTLNDPLYRDTGGRLADVMEIYSPAFENDVAQMWVIFAEVGRDLGVTIGPDTNVYEVSGTATGATSGDGGGLIDVGAIIGAVTEGAQRAGLGIAGLALLGLGLVLVIGPGNIAQAIPAGRIVNFARAAT